MKKPLTLFLLVISTTHFLKAQYYYQPYPLTAQIISNGAEWRMECSVFDSLLGTTQYYNGPWCSVQLTLDSSAGNVSYFGSSGLKDYIGGLTYDFEAHTFEPVSIDSCISCLNPGWFISTTNNCIEVEKPTFQDDEYEINIYYFDIKNSSWVNVSFVGYFAGGSAGGGFLASFSNDNDYHEYYGLNPISHTWQWIDNFTGDLNSDKDNDIIYFEGFDWINGTNLGWFIVNSPINSSGTLIEYQEGSFYGINNRNLFFQDDLSNPSYNHLYISTYDMVLSAWQTTLLEGKEVSSLKKNQGIFSLVDTAGSIITYGVYSYPQHVWFINSDTVGFITSDTIINGTVFFTDSSGNSYSRGYIDSTGWGNYLTPPQTFFHLLTYNYTSTGNLVYIKNYSIGTDSVLFDYGDGFTTKRTFDYHLYKVNGHYRTTSAANFNLCLTGYQNGVASTPNCQVINFVTAIDEPVKPQTVTMQNTAGKTLNILNTSGHALQVKVFDMAGRQIKKFNSSSNQLLINLKTLSTGMYMVQVYDQLTHETVSGKFVRE